jgi:polyphenol oxidase
MSVYLENLNRGRFETWTHRPEAPCYAVTQVHGVAIASLETLPCEADGIMASWSEIHQPIAIKTADCLPVVIEGEKGLVFLHAGWRGLKDGILTQPSVHMVHPIRALIGPSIQDCCFEVSLDFKENFPQSTHFSEREKKYFFNLQQDAKDQLKNTFPNLLVEITPICTCCHPGFHSYRKNKTTERNWNLYIKG